MDADSLREEFRSVRGYWDESLESVLQLDPEFLKAFLEFSAVPWRREGSLPPKEKELIYLAVYASSTLIHRPAIQRHIRNALRHGATQDEIVEVLEIVSTQGMHGPAVACMQLQEELGEPFQFDATGTPTSFSPAQRALRERLMQPDGRGWDANPRSDALIAVGFEWTDAFTDWMDVIWRYPTSRRFKELICVAMDAATTHMHVPGVRFHISEALRAGASEEEIREVLELVSVIGIESCLLGMPILIAETRRDSTPAGN